MGNEQSCQQNIPPVTEISDFEYEGKARCAMSVKADGRRIQLLRMVQMPENDWGRNSKAYPDELSAVYSSVSSRIFRKINGEYSG